MNILLVDAIIKNESIITKQKEMLNLLTTLYGEYNLTYTYQKLETPFTTTYLGKGKVYEIKDIIEKENVDILVMNFDLTPIQYLTLKNNISIPIIDRTGIILEIFMKNAKSKEARLQVEIANLQYLKARLINKEANYSQVTSGGGLKNRGTGEKQIDLDRFKFQRILKNKQKELEQLTIQRKSNRNMRFDIPLISIVGYTNAGKSTLMNKMLDKAKVQQNKRVLEENKLFATLETSTRYISAFNYPDFLLTDTVGFINDLPTTLIEAFKSTLEEISCSDLIIHVVDISSDNYKEQIETTNNILKELNTDKIPMIYLYNKFDKCTSYPFIPKQNELFVSLNNAEDIDSILNLIFNTIKENWTLLKFKMPINENINKIKKYGYIKSIQFDDDSYFIEGYFPSYSIKYIKDFLDN